MKSRTALDGLDSRDRVGLPWDMKIDSHHHLWAINDTDYPWIDEEKSVIRRDFLAGDAARNFKSSGIGGSVVVQARQIVEETEWLLGLAEANDWMRGVVGWVPLLEDAGEPFLERFAPHPKLCGVRHVVHDEPDDDFILREDFNEGIRRLMNYGLVYDILIFEKHLPQTIEFVDRHPEQIFVVDHIAKPVVRRDAFDEAWAKNTRELARRENVSCKVSGMVTEVRDAEWDVDLLRPYFETVLEAFGAGRLMFGSDWPVCLLRSEYGQWVECVTELVAGLSEEEKAAIWGGNAVRIYGF
ncbi:amidohydrolase family protein [Haloferula sp. A504]|uniref:amidohydrolase family protein n=1 Tax=Haloferula sp. A504 TaxID=3373601 RepID=UPI0031C0ED17|nr:amidohydrolase family protein [Verrucomicrobiaceae bacterium E54]